jgi:signal transduction histidine kinase/CheY-like chemotaxis protein
MQMSSLNVDQLARTPLKAIRPSSMLLHCEQLEQLRQVQKMEAVGQLACGVAHDFNNLLTAILGNLALLQGHLLPDDPNRALLEATERAAWRAASLSRQLLGYSRRTLLPPQALNANTILVEVMGLLKRTIDPRICLRTKSTADLWQVEADPNQLSQVLMNLCLNARDAVQQLLDGARVDREGSRGQRQATIVLETANVVLSPADGRDRPQARAGEFVRLCVRDNGTGIAPEVQAHLFEPFFTTKEPGKGTGLGLAMVLDIVSQHHGWVEFHSALDQGTRFDVYLPRHRAPVAPSNRLAAPRPSCVGQETILLVDDEALVRNLGRTILERFGYHVLLANDGQDALDVYRRQQRPIDLVVLDLTMPRLSGREALRQLREIDPAVRILYASGYSAEHLTAEDHEHSCGFVSKPYRPEDLAHAVRAALDRPRPSLHPLPS